MAEERVEEAPEAPGPTSLLPWAMAAAFLGGAGIAGFLIFGDQIGAWLRTAELGWDLRADQPVAIEVQQRVVIRRSSAPLEVLDVASAWELRPTADAHMPGSTVTWDQELESVRYRVTTGSAVTLDRVFPLPVGAEPPVRPPGTPRSHDESRAELLGLFVGQTIAATIEADASSLSAALPPDVLEANARAWYGVGTNRQGEPDALPDGALDVMQVAVDDQVGRVLRCVGPMVYAGSLRPGQAWTEVYPVEIPPWGEHDVKFDLKVDAVGDDGTVQISASMARRPRAGESLGAADTLSGLHGTGQYWLDGVGRRPLRGVTRIDATGKWDKQFAKVAWREAFALSDGGVPVIPPELLADPPDEDEGDMTAPVVEDAPAARPPLSPPPP